MRGAVKAGWYSLEHINAPIILAQACVHCDEPRSMVMASAVALSIQAVSDEHVKPVAACRQVERACVRAPACMHRRPEVLVAHLRLCGCGSRLRISKLAAFLLSLPLQLLLEARLRRGRATYTVRCRSGVCPQICLLDKTIEQQCKQGTMRTVTPDCSCASLNVVVRQAAS